MLSALRRASTSLFALILFGLLIAAFALWGVGDVFRTTNVRAVATVGSIDVTPQRLGRAVQQRLQQIREQFGESVDRAQLLELGLHRQVLGDLINQAMFEEASRRAGLRVSDRQVAEAIAEIEAFQGLDGQFSSFAYDQTLAQAGLTRAGFEREIRGEMRRQQLIDALIAPAQHLKVSPLSEPIFSYARERRQATLLTVPASAVTDIDVPDEEVLRAFFNDRQDQYRTPEYRSFQVLELSADTLGGDIDIDEDQLRAAYEERIGDYQQPEARELELASFASLEEAEALASDLDSDTAFSTAAAERTGFSQDELAIGRFTREEAARDFGEDPAAAIFAAADGETTGIVEANGRYNIFRIVAVESGINRSFDAARDELIAALRREEAIERVYDLVGTLEDEIAAGAELSEAGRVIGVPSQNYERLTRGGRRPDNSVVPVEPRYLEAAFALDLDQERRVEEGENDRFYVVDVTAIYPPEPKDFEEVRDQIISAWRTREQRRIAGERADQAVSEIEAGAGFDAAQAITEGEILRPGELFRLATGENEASRVSEPLKQFIFSLNEGEIAYDAAADGDGYVIVRLETIERGAPDPDSDLYRNFERQIGATFLDDLVRHYQQSLSDEIKVSVNDALIDQLYPSAAR